MRMIEDIIKDKNIIVDWTVFGARKQGEYVESWRILFWDKAFTTFIGNKVKKQYLKKNLFNKYPRTAQAVKGFVYKFVLYFLSSVSSMLWVSFYRGSVDGLVNNGS